MQIIERIRENWLKLIVIVIISVILDIILHQVPALIAPDIFNLSFSPPSIIVKYNLLAPVLTIALLISFGAMAIVFILIQEKIPGKKEVKGLMYGLSFTCLWFIGMFEGSLYMGTTIPFDIAMGIADAIPIILMCLLLGIFTADDSEPLIEEKKPRFDITLSISVFIITIIYIIGRYVAYITLIDSAYSNKVLETFLWTIGIGLSISIIYWILRPGLDGRSPINRSLLFSIGIFGSDWLCFMLFAPLLFDTSFIDGILRVIVDVVFVFFAVLITESLLTKFETNRSRA